MAAMEQNEQEQSQSRRRGGGSRSRSGGGDAGDPRPEVAAAGDAASLDQAVRQRAYELYQARGGAGGSETDDWLTAEREVRGQRQPMADAPPSVEGRGVQAPGPGQVSEPAVERPRRAPRKR